MKKTSGIKVKSEYAVAEASGQVVATQDFHRAPPPGGVSHFGGQFPEAASSRARSRMRRCSGMRVRKDSRIAGSSMASAEARMRPAALFRTSRAAVVSPTAIQALGQGQSYSSPRRHRPRRRSQAGIGVAGTDQRLCWATLRQKGTSQQCDREGSD